MSYAERIAQELQDRAMPIGETDGLHRITAEADAEIAALRARVEALEAGLKAMLPPHECELSITHNEHRSSYESAQEFLNACAIEPDELARPDEIERMVRADSIWCLQWYPDTPIGFVRRYAADLAALLKQKP